MPRQPVIFAPARDMRFGAGNPPGDIASPLGLGWNFQPDVLTTQTDTENIMGWASILGMTVLGGSVYSCSNTRIYKHTAGSGTIEASVHVNTIIGSGTPYRIGGITNDGNRLIFTASTTTPHGRLYGLRANLTGTAEILAVSEVNAFLKRLPPDLRNDTLRSIAFAGGNYYVYVGGTVYRVPTDFSSSTALSFAPVGINDFEISRGFFYKYTSATNIGAWILATGARDTESDITVPSGSNGIGISDENIFYIQRTSSRMRFFTRSPEMFTHYNIRRSIDGGTTWAYWRPDMSGAGQWDTTISPDTGPARVPITGGDGPLTPLGAGTLADETNWSRRLDADWDSGTTDHQFQVRNQGSIGDAWSTWSASVTVKPSETTTVNVTTPPADGDNVDDDYDPTWTVGTPQTYYQVTVRTRAGLLLQDSGLQTSAALTHMWGTMGDDRELGEIDSPPNDGTEVVITVEVWNADALRSSGTRNAIVRYTPPESPTNVSVSETANGRALRVEWIAQAAMGENPATVRIEVYRRVDGKDVTRRFINTSPLTNNADTAGMFDDFWARGNRLLEYNVKAYGIRQQSSPDNWVG